MFSDKILLLDKGRVAAFTSHEELMAENENLYHQLFQAQAEHYV